MFNHRHYIPILRWKAAEMGALKELSEVVKENTTPLIEFIMPQPSQKDIDDNKLIHAKDVLEFSRKKLEQNTPKIFEQLVTCWGQNALFIDVQLIDSVVRTKFLKDILKLSENKDIFLIPVINIIPVISFDTDAYSG